MSTHEERFDRIERAMEFLVESDAHLSARLDTLAATVERQQAEISEIVRAAAGLHEDVRNLVQVNIDAQQNVRDLTQVSLETQLNVRDLAKVTGDTQLNVRDLARVTVDTQQTVRDLAQITVETRQDVRSIAAETRDAINQMIGIAEGIAATATTFAERSTDHEIRISRLERQPPSDAA